MKQSPKYKIRCCSVSPYFIPNAQKTWYVELQAF